MHQTGDISRELSSDPVFRGASEAQYEIRLNFVTITSDSVSSRALQSRLIFGRPPIALIGQSNGRLADFLVNRPSDSLRTISVEDLSNSLQLSDEWTRKKSFSCELGEILISLPCLGQYQCIKCPAMIVKGVIPFSLLPFSAFQGNIVLEEHSQTEFRLHKNLTKKRLTSKRIGDWIELEPGLTGKRLDAAHFC